MYEENKKETVKRALKNGISEYQAAWLSDVESESDAERKEKLFEASVDESATDMDGSLSIDIMDVDYYKKEKSKLDDEIEFPDRLDLDPDESAVTRLSK